ncbi:hypothetical protein ACJMK2_011564 [Sinanodonta woodiana]|uniref:Protein moonraker-like n=1 Tax=Sinanodonta woodiana TaxID=1069815 RepID=A0ABD3V7U8_SINWO
MAVMASRGPQNQLQFNLDVPLSSNNLATRFHKPHPIIVERAGPGPVLGGSQATHVTKTSLHQQSQGVHFVNISEEKLALAVHLAQRDLKKRKEEDASLLPGKKVPSNSDSKSRSPPRAGRTRVVHSKEYKERLKKTQAKGQVPLRVQEHGKNIQPRDSGTQTPPRGGQSARDHLPVTTDSPPTRDTDIYGTHKSSQPQNPQQEISRLQRELESYLQQIQVIEQRAMQEQSQGFLQQPAKSRKKEGYLSDEEDEVRKAIRTEEQATRMARQIYFLRQQVRELQNEITRVGPEKIKHTKKSHAVSRLAAAHRSAVRTIQTFVSQLPKQDLRRGLPNGYHELALLIRQLSLLSTQVGTGDEAKVREELIKMVDRVDELNKIWSEEADIDTTEADPFTHQPRRKSPPGRPPLKTEDLTSRRLVQQKPHQQRGKENRPKGLLKKRYFKSNRTATKPEKQDKLTPERQAVLRAGLEALMKQDVSYEAPSLQNNQQGGSRPMAWNIPADDQHSKSLIIPRDLQSKRERARKGFGLDLPEVHFRDPTVSSNLKAVTPAKQQQNDSMSAPPSPRQPWKPGGTPKKSSNRPRRSRSQSPGDQSRVPLMTNLDKDLIKKLFPGEEFRNRNSRSRSPPLLQQSRRTQRSRSGSRSPVPRGRALSPRQRLQKILHGAEDAVSTQEKLREAAEIKLQGRLNGKSLANMEVDADMLSDMILNDVLWDTAEELGYLEDNESTRKEAVRMQDNPTLENIFQKLEQMEIEKMDIRRRWGTIEYDEPVPSRVRGDGVSHQPQRPTAPIAMEITRHVQTKLRSQNMEFSKDKDSPIIFTKVKQATRWDEKRTVVGEESEIGEMHETVRGPPKIKISIPNKVLQDIHGHKEKYESYLRSTAHQSKGRFDPWLLMEEIADMILDDCVKDIDKELADIEEAIVHHVCKTEFAVEAVQPETPSPEQADPEPAEIDYSEPVDYEEEDVQESLSPEQSQSEDESVEVSFLDTEELETPSQ